MSRLSSFLRAISGGRLPNAILGPRFGEWKQLGHSGERRTNPAAAHTAKTLKIDHFWEAPAFGNTIDQLHHAFQLIPSKGYITECGVYKGRSLNWLAKWATKRTDPRVFGFDSFEGLPHDWIMGKDGRILKADRFQIPSLPKVLPNACLVQGWFDATLIPWLQQNPGPIAMLHNDSDLYSSTILTLRAFNERLMPGSVIVFDELCDWKNSGVYDNWEQGEWKALIEWMGDFNRTVRVLSRDSRYAAAVQVVG